MRELGVSHTTLREALQSLAAKGLIAARARVGTRILERSNWHMFDANVLEWHFQTGIPSALLSMLLRVLGALLPRDRIVMPPTDRNGARKASKCFTRRAPLPRLPKSRREAGRFFRSVSPSEPACLCDPYPHSLFRSVRDQWAARASKRRIDCTQLSLPSAIYARQGDQEAPSSSRWPRSSSSSAV